MPRHTETAKEGQQTFASTAVASRRLHLSHVEQSVLGKDGVFPSVHVLACRVRWHHLSVLPIFRVRVRREERRACCAMELSRKRGLAQRQAAARYDAADR